MNVKRQIFFSPSIIKGLQTTVSETIFIVLLLLKDRQHCHFGTDTFCILLYKIEDYSIFVTRLSVELKQQIFINVKNHHLDHYQIA